VLLQGQSADKTIAPMLIEGLKPDRDLVADRGYDACVIVDLVERRGGRAHIPTSRDRKVQRSVDLAIYRQRNLVERFFNKLKHFRRVATRYEKTAQNFLAAVLLAATRLWARFESTAYRRRGHLPRRHEIPGGSWRGHDDPAVAGLLQPRP
jgi:transposase